MAIRSPTVTVLEGTSRLAAKREASGRWGIGPSAALITLMSGGLWGLIYMAVRALLR